MVCACACVRTFALYGMANLIRYLRLKRYFRFRITHFDVSFDLLTTYFIPPQPPFHRTAHLLIMQIVFSSSSSDLFPIQFWRLAQTNTERATQRDNKRVIKMQIQCILRCILAFHSFTQPWYDDLIVIESFRDDIIHSILNGSLFVELKWLQCHCGGCVWVCMCVLWKVFILQIIHAIAQSHHVRLLF